MAVELMADVIKYTNDTNKDIKYDHSEFPHNLVTIDYGANGEVIAVSVIVPKQARIEIKDREQEFESSQQKYGDTHATVRDRAIRELPALSKQVKDGIETLKRIANG